MGVSYREEMARRQKASRKNSRVPWSVTGTATTEGAAIWAKYARVARYRHRAAGAPVNPAQARLS